MEHLSLANVMKSARHAKPAILVCGSCPRRHLTLELGGALYATQSQPPPHKASPFSLVAQSALPGKPATPPLVLTL
jgi:hypothetical protein